MKKKQLLKILANQSILKEVCDTYYCKYKDLLISFDDDEEISGIHLLEGDEFKNSESFDMYLRKNANSPEKVKMLLNSLYDSLVDFCLNPKNLTVQRTAKKNMRKSNLKRVKIVAGVLIAVAVVALALTVLSVVGAINKDAGDAISTVIGTMDCVFGITFFIYEIFNDKLKEDEIDSGNPEVIGKYVKIVGIGGDVKAKGNAKVTGMVNNYADGDADGSPESKAGEQQNVEITGIGGSVKGSGNAEVNGIVNNYSSRKGK